MSETRKGIKLPKTIASDYTPLSANEKQTIGKAVAKANGEKYQARAIEKSEQELNKTIIRQDSSELIVITYAKKLCAYVMTVTQKSPKHFRYTFVNRLNNYCLDLIENLFYANSLRADNTRNKFARKEYQQAGYIRLKLIDYISFLAYENGCILKKQYELIAQQCSDCSNLLLAWTKSAAT